MVAVKFDNGESVEIVSDKLRIVSGWASVQIKDLQGHVVSAADLVKAMVTYMVDGGILLYGHTNTPVGKVIYWDLRKHDETGEPGIYIVAQISSNNEIQDKVWELVKKGVIVGFSIGGYGKPSDAVIEKADGTSEVVKKVTDIILKEISIVESPANEKAVIEDYNALAKGNVMYFENLSKAVESIRLNALDAELRLGITPKRHLAEYFAHEYFNKTYDELSCIEKYAVAERIYYDFIKKRERDPCKAKYFDYDSGHFKGGKGERFKNCVKYQMECQGHDKESAEAICAEIGRRAGKIK